MSVFRVQKTKNYTVMSNHHLKDTNLSLKAKGLLSLMLSLPEKWDYSMKGLCSICLEQEKAIKSTLDELKSHGYLTVDKVRNSQGRYEYIYTIFEEPNNVTPDENTPPHHNGGVVKKPDPHYPQVDEPGVDDPAVEKDGQLNTNILNTKELNTNKSNTIPSFIHSTDVMDSEVTSNESDGMKEYKEICNNIDFAKLISKDPGKRDVFLFVKGVISSVCQSSKPVKVRGREIDNRRVLQEYKKLDKNAIIHIANGFIKLKGKIKDPYAFMASALYQTPQIMLAMDTKNDSGRTHSYDLSAYDEFTLTGDADNYLRKLGFTDPDALKLYEN